MKSTSSIANAPRIEAFQKIHADFKDILKHEKCRSCSCFYADVLNTILEKIRAFRTVETDHCLIAIENDFERWTKDADLLKMHG